MYGYQTSVVTRGTRGGRTFRVKMYMGRQLMHIQSVDSFSNIRYE